MEVLNIALPLTGEELLQQIRDGKAIFSTKLGRFPPREARPHEAPIIMRTDPDQDVELMISRLRCEYPRESRQIIAPIRNMYDYFDHYDVQLHGTGIIHAALLGIAKQNAERAQHILTFAESWRYQCWDQFMAITPDTQDLFRPQDVGIYGNDFLGDVLAYLKDARMAMSQIIPPVASGFVPSAAGSPAPFNDPAIIASQVSSRQSSGQSSTSSGAYKDSMSGHRHSSVQSEPENKLLRSIRPSLLRISSYPEGLESTTPLTGNPKDAAITEPQAHNGNGTIIVPSAAISAVQIPKAASAEKVSAPDFGQIPSINFLQNPVQHGAGGSHGAHPPHPENPGFDSRSFVEREDVRPHSQPVEPGQLPQRPPLNRPTGVQTMRHWDRQKKVAYDAAPRRLSGIAPPPPSHMIEPFPPFVPFAVPTPPTHFSEPHGPPQPIINMGPQGTLFEERQYRGFGVVEHGLGPQIQQQQPTNLNRPMLNYHPAPSLSITKTRNGPPHVNIAHAPPMDAFLRPPLPIQRPPLGSQVVGQLMPHRHPQIMYSNDARVSHDAHMVANQQAWQQQMREQANFNQALSFSQKQENNRPSERGDRQWSHKRGRGNSLRNRTSPNKSQSEQSGWNQRNSQISHRESGNSDNRAYQQFVPEVVPTHCDSDLQERGTQNPRYTWKPIDSSTVLLESPKAISPGDESSQVVSEKPSLQSTNVSFSSRNNTWNSSEGRKSGAATEADKLFISGPGITENDVRHLVEPYGQIICLKEGNRFKKPSLSPFFFVTFATEAEARRTETALNNHVLANPPAYLKVNKAYARNFPNDRESEFCQGPRGFPSNQSRNHSVPHGKIENRSYAPIRPTMVAPFKDKALSRPETTGGSRTPPQTPKSKYQDREQADDNPNLSGTVRRKKPIRTSVKTIAEEITTAETDAVGEAVEPGSDKSVAGSRLDEFQDQRQAKGVKEPKKGQPSTAIPTSKETKKAPGTQIHAPQLQRFENEHNQWGRLDDRRARPVSLGDFIHGSSLQGSFERSDDHSQPMFLDGSPTRKIRKQGGNIRSKPQPRKESFPALGSNRVNLPSKAQEAVQTKAVKPEMSKVYPKDTTGRLRERPATPKASQTADVTASQSDAVSESRESVSQELSLAANTFVHMDKASELTEPSVQAQSPKQCFLPVSSTRTRESVEEVHHQAHSPGSREKLKNENFQDTGPVTLANPAVSALASESWANELESPDVFYSEPAEAITTTLQNDSPNARASFEKSLVQTAFEKIDVVPSSGPEKQVEPPRDIAKTTAPAGLPGSSTGNTESPSQQTNSEPLPTLPRLVLAEMSTPEAESQITAIDTAPMEQNQLKKQFYPEIPPRKQHSEDTPKAEGKLTSNLIAISSDQLQVKPKQNRKRGNISKTTFEVTDKAGSTDQSIGKTRLNEALESATPVASSEVPIEVSDLRSPIVKPEPETKTLDILAEPSGTEDFLPMSNQLESGMENQQSLDTSEDAPTSQLTSADSAKPSNIIVPPRTSSIVPTAAPISTHKKKQKTPTKGNAKKTKKAVIKQGVIATETEIELATKVQKDADEKKGEPKIGWQEPEPEPKVSHLQDPEEVEDVDISDQIARRLDYPTLDRANAVHFCGGSPRIERSGGPLIILLNKERESDQGVDLSRLNNFCDYAGNKNEGNGLEDDKKEVQAAKLGSPQLSSQQRETSPPKAAEGTLVETKKPKKKNDKKKKKKTKAGLASESKPDSSASSAFLEETPAFEKALLSKEQIDLAVRDSISKSERFAADPESFIEEFREKRQEPEQPIQKPKDIFQQQVSRYYAQKDRDYSQEWTKNMERLSTEPYSTKSDGRGCSRSPERALQVLKGEREGSARYDSKRQTTFITERKIELLNTPALPQFDRNFRGLGISTDAASVDKGAQSESGKKREFMTHKGVEFDKFSDPPLTPFTPIITRLPTPTTSEFIRTPSTSTSPETVMADRQGAEVDALQLNDQTLKETSFDANAYTEKMSDESKRCLKSSESWNGDVAKDDCLTARTTKSGMNQAISKLLGLTGGPSDLSELADRGLNVPGFSPMLDKMTLAKGVENEEVLSFAASKLDEENPSTEALFPRYNDFEENGRGPREDENAVGPSAAEIPHELEPESLFFPDYKDVPVKREMEILAASAAGESREGEIDKDVYSSKHQDVPVKKEEEDLKQPINKIPQYQSAMDTAEKSGKDMADADSLATFVSEIQFDIDPNDPMINQLANFAVAQPLASEDVKAEAPTAKDLATMPVKQESELGVPNLSSHKSLSAGVLNSQAKGKGRESSTSHRKPDLTGSVSPTGSHSSDIIDAKIVDALKSLPASASKETVVNVVNKCIRLGLAKEDDTKREALVDPSRFAGSILETSSLQTTKEQFPQTTSKKATKKTSKKSRSSKGSTPNAWAQFAANVEKDEAAQRDAHQLQRERDEAENEKSGAAPALDLGAMNQIWRKVETGETGHRRVSTPLDTVKQETAQDETKPDSNVTDSNVASAKDELDATLTDSSTATVGPDSEATPKPDRSPERALESVTNTNTEAFSANNALDKISETYEPLEPATPSGSPSRVATLRSSPAQRTVNTSILGLNTSFPPLPPPSFFALSNPSSPIQELSEDVIERHNNASVSPRRHVRGSSSNLSEYSTTSSTHPTGFVPVRRPPLPAAPEPSWSNIAASSSGRNVRLSPVRNAHVAHSPARLSPARNIARTTRTDARSSLVQSVASRESEEEDAPRGRSTTPAGSHKGAGVRRQGTAAGKRGRDGDEWSVAPGEKMWGSSSDA